MMTSDQFLQVLGEVESSNNPEEWGDGGRAVGRWQVHPDRFVDELRRNNISPMIGETWDELVERIVTKIFTRYRGAVSELTIAMYWHVGHWTQAEADDWDTEYAARFENASARL